MTTAIDVNLRDPAQLFQTTDPFPFRENGLEPDAERYFIRKAAELKGQEPLKVVLRIAQPGAPSPDGRDPGAVLVETLRSAFAAASDEEARAMGDLLRNGRRYLVIGVCVLAALLLLASQSEQLIGDRVLASLVRESAIVFGWVAVWRPAEIFLYEWMPFASRRASLRRLSQADIEVRWRAAG